jgi:ferrous iron transport protein B
MEVKNLADLMMGETAVITKVKGHGAFRKRITEMGFVSGTRVRAIKKAPMQDPVEFELMGYRVSLRNTEARLIEIIAEKDYIDSGEYKFEGTLPEALLEQTIRQTSRIINVALVGNPNCGKTTLFNLATGKREKVGNYGGVTVDLKTAVINKNNYRIQITDLPGTYSLSEYTPEELFVRTQLRDAIPDVVVNVIDASNLERNFYLTTQLIDMNIKVVIALNMYDELEKKGDTFNYSELGKMIGVPIIPTVAKKGKGIDELVSKIIEVYEDRLPEARHIHINYGHFINASLDKLRAEIKQNPLLSAIYHSQYIAVKLLEGDKAFTREIAAINGTEALLEITRKEIERLEKEFREKSETIITDAKYAFIRGALKETYLPSPDNIRPNGRGIDALLTHKWFGFPVFLAMMWFMFQLTFSLGSYPMEWLSTGIGALGDLIKGSMAEGSLRDLLVDGIIGGVGGVVVFLPNILIMFFCISLMEDTGYMARAAFIMDRLMHRIGLHGKSFIPLLMGFGCNVPAIMATRTLESRKDRLLTMLIIPFMSCSARLPVYVLLISAFFPEKQGLVLLSIYLIGIALAVGSAMIFNKIIFRKQDAPFVMELPPYRIPTMKSTVTHMWHKSVQYVKKMGTIILIASVIIWALGYFPRNAVLTKDYEAETELVVQNSTLAEAERTEKLSELLIDQEAEKMERSFIGRMGHFITPVIEPLGFDWKIGVSIITGLAAKEIVIGSMGVLYHSRIDDGGNAASLHEKLRQQVHTSGPKKGQIVFTPLVAYTMMVFILIYFPCVAVIAAIRKEANWKWAVFTIFYTTIMAWVAAYAVYQIGSLF